MVADDAGACDGGGGCGREGARGGVGDWVVDTDVVIIANAEASGQLSSRLVSNY